MQKDLFVKEQVPESILEIADVIGYEKTLLLVDRLGGLDFSVPVGSKESYNKQMLINAIGEDSALTFMKYYGGARVYIPRCQTALISMRNKKFYSDIKTAVEKGESKSFAVQSLSHEYGFSERWGYKLLSKFRANQCIGA